MGLIEVVRELYASEINCGLQTFWDGGLTAWIGDELNGRRSEAAFHDRDAAGLDQVAGWLRAEAINLYPNSEFARRHGGRP